MFAFLKRLFSFGRIKEDISIEKKAIDYPHVDKEIDHSQGEKVIEYCQQDTNINHPQQSKPSTEIHIGLDFGTSYTKACWYFFDKDQRYIVNWNPDWNFKDCCLLPSIVWLDDHNNLSMTKLPSSNQSAIKFFKMAIAKESIGGIILPRGIRTHIDPYYLYTSFYISRCLWWIEQAALNSEKKLSQSEIIWSGNIGIPISYLESEKRKVFDEIIAASCYMLQKNISDVEPLERLDALYQESLNAVAPQRFSSVPELYAEALGLFSDYHTPEGYYTFFDVGGGTVDGAVMEFTRNEGSPQVNFLTSSVKLLGMEYISIYSNNQEKMQELKNEIITQTSELIMKAKNKVLPIWKREGTLPILMCGGGHSSKWHIKAIRSTYWNRQHYNCGIPEYDIQDLQVNHIEANGLPAADKHRFLIAIGLSVPEGMGPLIVGFPKNNPESTVEIRKKEIDYDDIQRELYGDY